MAEQPHGAQNLLDGQVGKLEVKRSTIGRTNLLKSVQRPLGASFTLEFEKVGNTYAMPNAAWVLSEVKMFDGLDAASDGPDSLHSSFVYEDGYYERYEREFYGFGKVTTRTHNTADGNSVNTQLVQTFHNDNYYHKGLLESETLLNSKGKLFVKKVNKYLLKDPISGQVLEEISLENDPGRIFPALKSSEQYFYEGTGDAGVDTKITFAYDAHGNVSQIIDEGGAGSEDDLTADIQYHYLPDPHVLSQPKKIVVSGTDKTYRRRETDLYPKTGLVKEIRQYLNEEGAAVYNFRYDAFGNLQKVTRPANPKEQRMEVDYVYDNQVHSYVEKVSNSFGYTSSAK